MAKLRMSPIALSSIIQQKYCVESIFHLTCRDRNTIGFRQTFGSLCPWCTQYPHTDRRSASIGDHPDATGVFDVDSTGLIEIARCLNEGHDLKGNPLGAATNFYIGTTANPGADDLDKEILRLEGKKKAGAQFIQTQPRL